MARINNAAARAKLGILYNQVGDGRLFERMHDEILRVWTVVTREKVGKVKAIQYARWH